MALPYVSGLCPSPILDGIHFFLRGVLKGRREPDRFRLFRASALYALGILTIYIPLHNDVTFALSTSL
ncbi:MAG: hypothetical protein J4G01_09885 [Dehalococcoidia bacterium]|nr:hypothetical protein [Dehalococcoidia bacterium]